jgi:hypothetical protein
LPPTSGVQKVFICYRRKDSRYVVDHIYRRLVEEFGKEHVFKDVDAIPLATDYRTVLVKSIQDSTVFLTVIGPRWLGFTNKSDGRALDDPDDPVRMEIELALGSRTAVIPVLVDDASLPEPNELPPSLQPLVYQNGAVVGPDPHFDIDVDRLIRGIRSLPQATPQPAESERAGANLEPSPSGFTAPQPERQDDAVDRFAFSNSRGLLGLGVVLAIAGIVWIGFSNRNQQTPAAPTVSAVSLEQGWTAADRDSFYSTTQGSQLIPYAWYLALEQAGSQTPFGDQHLSRYGFLSYPGKTSADDLPLGLVRDTDMSWMGLTCAACHVGEVRSGGKAWRIDGGTGDLDLWTFLDDLDRALSETALSATSGRFKRFAAKVADQTPISEASLFSALTGLSKTLSRFVSAGRPDTRWGRARIDALGMTFNQTTGMSLNEPANLARLDAPVSVPFLWDTHWHDVAQWNGSTPNQLSYQRLARNVSKALGAFASFGTADSPLSLSRLQTSASREGLVRLEHLVSRLRSPVWPPELASIDRGLAQQGRELYSAYCQSCHEIRPLDVSDGHGNAKMIPLSVIGTDTAMARDAMARTVRSGALAGARLWPQSSPVPTSLRAVDLTARMSIAALLAPPARQAGAAPVDQDAELASQLRRDEVGAGYPLTLSPSELGSALEQFVQAQVQRTQQLQYKARPLDGIWATGPYLHNGSVPNLRSLLSPASKRPTRFYVGNREFDSAAVGFSTQPAPGAFEFDTSLPGNRNIGHDVYRAKGEPHEFTEQERLALIEYLKTL